MAEKKVTTKTERTKLEAMAFFGLSRMPKKHVQGHCYTKAIAKVRKYDGNFYYVAQTSDETGNMRVAKDFEDIYAIKEIVEVYPIDAFIPQTKRNTLQTMSREERIAFIMEYGENIVPCMDSLQEMEDNHLFAICMRIFRLLKVRCGDDEL